MKTESFLICAALIFVFSAAQVCFGQNQPPVLTLDEAINLALQQASAYKSAQIGERIAAEDIRQARAAFYPKINIAPNVIFTSPSLGKPADGSPRPPSFLGANAIGEFQGIIAATGEIDTSGRLKSALRRSRFLLEAAKFGSATARLDLVKAVTDAYFNFALSTTKRRGAEMNLEAAQEFENNTKLLLDAGEVAPVDLVRARLQTAQRQDELLQANADEIVGADNLKLLVGYDFTEPIAAVELLEQIPILDEIENFTTSEIAARPELVQFDAQLRAAEEDAKFARQERRPQINYSVGTGFISDSLAPNSIKNGLGIQAQIGVTIPLFDKGASRSREAQANLRAEQIANDKQLATRQFAQEFFTARAQALAAATRIRQIGDSIKDAEMNVSASTARYRAGEAAIVEVTDALNILVTLRQSLYQAIFDYQTARTRLLRSVGK